MNYTPKIINETLKCRRYYGASYIDGKYYEKNYEEFQFLASVQPIKEYHSIEMTGDIKEDAINIYTLKLLLIRDIIFYNNKTYEVVSIKNWGFYIHAIARGVNIL